MSLPTPPKTSHRDKENRPVASSSGRVEWSKELNHYHTISPQLSPITRSNSAPKKSILKHSSSALPFYEDKPREVTPEPQQPKDDSRYLQFPISQITSSESSLTTVIEGFAVLAARLRTCLGEDVESEASWPLFDPIRNSRDALFLAMRNGLANALEEPVPLDEPTCSSKPMLPSPQKSPRKKRDGMSAEQIKHARDLSTTCLSVTRLLGIIFVHRAIFCIFTVNQLSDLVTQLLAIPLAINLPCLNARKICALAIWLIQTQRLPPQVLYPAKDRVAYAIRRGIEGELGKEGKKGSVSDGLKAIHDLCIGQPATFIPAFTEVLPSLLNCLLASSLNIRLLACHALGGFAYGSTLIPRSDVHDRIASAAISFLKAPSKASPLKKASPGALAESPIIRTLRATLNATEWQVAAQGPVWSLSALGSLSVLLGSQMWNDGKLCRLLMSLLSIGKAHKKSSIRFLATFAWRCTIWAFFQPPSVVPSSDEEEESIQATLSPSANDARQSWWKITDSVIGWGAGPALIGSLMGKEQPDDESLRRAISLLRGMTGNNLRSVFEDALVIIQRMVSFESVEMDWHGSDALPYSFFSAYPGLLSADIASLSAQIRAIAEENHGSEAIRGFTPEELVHNDTLKQLRDIWLYAAQHLNGFSNISGLVAAASKTWESLMSAQLRVDGDEEAASCAELAGEMISQILEELGPSKSLSNEPGTSEVLNQSDISIKLDLVQQMWRAVLNILPRHVLHIVAERVIPSLTHVEDDLSEGTIDLRSKWAEICAEVLLASDTDHLKGFLCLEAHPDFSAWEWTWSAAVRSRVWGVFVAKWMQEQPRWEDILALLATPLSNGQSWELTPIDFETWEDLLIQGMTRALDLGRDSVLFLDDVGEALSTHFDMTATSATGAADCLLRHLAFLVDDITQVPKHLLEFVNESLRCTYPPAPNARTPCFWVQRTLTGLVEKCPQACIEDFLASLQEGLTTWFADEHSAFQGEDYDDILCLYEHTLLRMRQFPKTTETIHSFLQILDAVFCNQEQKPLTIMGTFVEFWEQMFGGIPTDQWPSTVQELLRDAVTTPAIDDKIEDEEAVAAILLTTASPPSSPVTPNKAALSGPSTPPRPQKPRASLPLTSPESPTLRIQSSRSQHCNPPSPKKRKLDNKENEAPIVRLTSQDVPARFLSGTKRRASDVAAEEEPAQKKVRVNGTLLTDDDGIANSAEVGQTTENSGPNVSKKRKRLIMDAVEVPMLRDVRKLSLETDGIELVAALRPTQRLRHSANPSCLKESGRSSSDDDPHVGQVTPHHLLSPPLRVKRAIEEDAPSSDDSDLTTESPSKGVVRRRLERTPSAGKRALTS